MRWYALLAECLGVVMIVLDSTIVSVALSSIGADLRFEGSHLAWVVNGYLVPFAGFVLLWGRLGDRYGHHRVFLFGVTLFTVASLWCGLARSALVLIAGRIIQGLAGAAVFTAVLPLIVSQFEGQERAKAIAVYSSACAGGGTLGLLLGGILTSALGWRWIFIVNIPVGLIVCALFRTLAPHKSDAAATGASLDISGSIAGTSGLMLAVYAILGAAEAGWNSIDTLLPLGGAGLLGAAFVRIEARSQMPLVPRRVVHNSNILVGVVSGALWEATYLGWLFISPLYLQQVLGYDALRVGLAFVPANVIMAALSLLVAPRLATRLGAQLPFAGGLALMGAGLALFARLPLESTFTIDVLPGMLLLGIGSGMAYSPLVLSTLQGVAQEDYGVASGALNSSCTLGGALALSMFASIASIRTAHVASWTSSIPVALSSGYHLAYGAAAVLAMLSAFVGALLLPSRPFRAAPGS